MKGRSQALRPPSTPESHTEKANSVGTMKQIATIYVRYCVTQLPRAQDAQAAEENSSRATLSSLHSENGIQGSFRDLFVLKHCSLQKQVDLTSSLSLTQLQHAWA